MVRANQEKHDEKYIGSLPIVGEQPKSEKEEKFLREFCEFEFINMEDTGLSHKFPYGSTKKSHTFLFLHGGKYRLPRFIAKHIDTRSTPIWKWRPDGTGGMKKEKIGDKPRFQMRQIYAA